MDTDLATAPRPPRPRDLPLLPLPREEIGDFTFNARTGVDGATSLDDPELQLSLVTPASSVVLTFTGLDLEAKSFVE